MKPVELLNQRSTGLAKYFLSRYPRRSALIVALLILSGFAEGFGVIALLPVLQIAGSSETAPDSVLMRTITEVLGFIGLEPTLGVLLVFIVIGMTFKALFLWIASKQVGYTAAHVATDLRLMLLRALLAARWGYFTSQPAGHLSSAIGTEAMRASTAYKDACLVLAGIVQVLVYLGLAFSISWQVALYAIVGGTVAIALLGTFVRAARQAGREQTQQMRALIGRLTDALQGIKPIKAMAREANLWPLLRHETLELNRAQEHQILATETRRLFQEPLLVIMLAIGLYAALAIANLPFASVMVMAFLFYRLVAYLQNIQGNYQALVTGESAFWSLHDSVRMAEAEAEDSPGSHVPPPLQQAITLESVYFSYGNKKVLEDVSLSVPAGEFVTLVGPSGAGKTTIVDLLIGLYRPQAGEIMVDGVPLSEVDLPAWRSMIGYVPQEMFLFHDSILQNVTLGDESIGRERVREALITAGAWEFVSRLPEGVDTIVGERGSRLSGGQRQRIAIARALVGDSKLLILDEVTTSLDPKTEAEIIDTLRQLHGETTIVAISHQHAMRDTADIVYQIRDGVVTDVRAPSELSKAPTG